LAAGGLATVFTFQELKPYRKFIELQFVGAVRKEFEIAKKEVDVAGDTLSTVAIVDDRVTSQGLYKEMLAMASLLESNGVRTFVLSPEQLLLDEDKSLYHLVEGTKVPIQFLYNRMTDFRMGEKEHAHIRTSALANKIILSPHPGTYVRVADKRNLIRLDHAVVPRTMLLSERSVDEWMKERKGFVFKPADGAGSKGV
tara:strand:+ start:265 stop:858 length:594 start_codon:yes stop_codon:yes gene_type:complete